MKSIQCLMQKSRDSPTKEQGLTDTRVTALSTSGYPQTVTSLAPPWMTQGVLCFRPCPTQRYIHSIFFLTLAQPSETPSLSGLWPQGALWEQKNTSDIKSLCCGYTRCPVALGGVDTIHKMCRNSSYSSETLRIFFLKEESRLGWRKMRIQEESVLEGQARPLFTHHGGRHGVDNPTKQNPETQRRPKNWPSWPERFPRKHFQFRNQI